MGAEKRSSFDASSERKERKKYEVKHQHSDRPKSSSRKTGSSGSPYSSPKKVSVVMGEHSGSTVALVLFNLLVFGGCVTLLHLSVFPQHAGGVFERDIRNVTSKWMLSVTPADWTHFIWSGIFGGLLLAKLYTLITLCRRNAVGPVYTTPGIVSRAFLIIYTVALLCLAVWVILWDRQFLIAACAVLGASCLAFCVAMGVLYAKVHRHGPWMSRHAKVDIWMYRILWHNCLAALTTMMIMAALYNLGVVLRHVVKLEEQLVAYVVLGSISGLMLLWFVLENTALDRFVRFTVTPYAVIIEVLVGVYYRQYNDASEETGYFLVALLGVAVFCLVARIGLLILRAVKSPLYTTNKIGDDPVLSYAA